MSASGSTEPLPTFSGEFIRLLVGAIAFAFPVIVWIASSFAVLTSISASYYTGARNIFVGLLFVLGAFLFVYKGRGRGQLWIAKVGALAPIVAAICPTSCDQCGNSVIADIHLGAGAVLFAVAAYFCLVPFRQSARTKPGDEARRRTWFYTGCGVVIVACLVILAIAKFAASVSEQPGSLTYWAEFVMLWAFGSAWLVAAKLIPWFTSKDERLKLSKELGFGAAKP